MNEACAKTEKEAIASVIDNLADMLASKSNQILERVGGQLQCISRPPSVEACEKNSPPLELYPAFFESLRCSLKAIERNLNGINERLDCVEL